MSTPQRAESRYNTLTYEVDDRVAIVTLNRPKRMNAFSLELCGEVKAAFAEADRDPAVRVVIITGAGGKAFSAGYDIKDGDEGMKEGLAAWSERLQADLAFTYAPWNCTKPVIAMIDGYCLAGALEFVQMCDMRYCTHESTFGVVETRFSAGIATLAMPWIMGPRCRELIYTGDTIDGAEAHRLGLVNRVMPRSKLRAETMKIARRMGQVALACLQHNKRALNGSYRIMGFDAALGYGNELAAMMDATVTPEYKAFEDIRRKDGLTAAIRWREQQFKQFE
jgi:enoyl-CoA hydratase/carnithine racemase